MSEEGTLKVTSNQDANPCNLAFLEALKVKFIVVFYENIRSLGVIVVTSYGSLMGTVCKSKCLTSTGSARRFSGFKT
jgi:hypothetical protein